MEKYKLSKVESSEGLTPELEKIIMKLSEAVNLTGHLSSVLHDKLQKINYYSEDENESISIEEKEPDTHLEKINHLITVLRTNNSNLEFSMRHICEIV